MLFNSYVFICCFLPITLFLFYFFRNFKNYIIFISSLIFYSYWDIRFLPLLLISILFNYNISFYLHKKYFLLLGILFNLLILFIFKYYNFFISEISFLFNNNINIINLVLPLGISFYTFQQISFLIDKKKYFHKDRISFIKYSSFIIFFPQLIAGPIVRYEWVNKDFSIKNKRFLLHNISIGLIIFTIGLFKKVIIADGFSEYSNILFDEISVRENSLQLIETWICVTAYSLQIYFDFSGYSDMALGVARMFGIKLPFNFIEPYKSLTITEFWRRWHITLSGWLRDYIFIPLGGSKKNNYITIRNLLVVMILGGLWHGAGWTFLIWGIVHAFFLIEERYFTNIFLLPHSKNILMKILLIFIFFIKINISWVFFRSNDLSSSLKIIEAMFNFNQIIIPFRFLFLENILFFLDFKEGITFRYFNGITSLKKIFFGLFIISFGLSVYRINYNFGYLQKNYFYRSKILFSYIQKNIFFTFIFSFIITLIFLYAFTYISKPTTFLYFQF